MDSKDITTAGDANWRAACESEARSRDAWEGRFGWIRREYATMSRELDALRARRPTQQARQDRQDPRSVLPFPVTTAQDIGWLSGRRPFQLEVLGPYPYTAPSRPPITPPGTL